MTRTAPLLAALLLGACAPASTLAGRDPIPAATSTGEPRQCVPLQQIRETAVRSDQVIDFLQPGGRRGYRVTLPQPCPGLGFERRFSYATSITQLCAQDIITVLQQTAGLVPGASCGLAPFQPIELTRR